MSCFTATAKQKVVTDICDYFKKKLGLELRLFVANSERKNLRYSVLYTETDDEKYSQLRNIIIAHRCPTIVYVSRTKRSKELALRLSRDGISALPFNGKMESAEKVANQNSFMNDETQVVVATSAFGMGVDKNDVGLVVHYDISDSLENYIQEAGRAGRNPHMQADCYVLYSDNDLDKHFILLNQTKLSISEIQQVWKAIKDLTEKRDRVSCSPLEIARQAGWNDDDEGNDIETRVKSAITALEEAGYIRRGNNMPRIFATSIKVNSMDEARTRIMASPLFDSTTRDEATRIIRSLISSRATYRDKDTEAESRIDYLADILGLTKETVMRNVNLMRQEGILTDTHDLRAFVDRTNLFQKLGEIIRLERFVLDNVEEDFHVVNYKQLNSIAQAEGNTRCSIKKIRALFHFLFIKGYIMKKETLVGGESVCLRLSVNRDTTISRFEQRIELCHFIVRTLAALPAFEKNKMITFSMVELLEQYNSTLRNGSFDSLTLNDMEEALLYLSRMGLLKIEGGFMVVYNSIQLHRLVERHVRYNKEQYRLLDEFYRQRIQQIHIVGEYANMMVRDYDAALQFVRDYFLIDYRSFITKYFKGERRTQISRNITPEKYKQIFETLSERQREIIDDKQSKCIVVAAGPGSGKTRVLVHKLASLLLMEDVKHEQLLMLTFSRAAATEFKKRLVDLVGNAAHFVDIKTFHSYSFDLLGKQSSFEELNDVVSSAAKMIENGEVEENKIAKRVLVLDEAQDMRADDYRLVKALIKRNEDMRIIAVGDDDQNIYAFRGSDNAHLRSLVSNQKATLYELVENYRSDRAIVDFANEFVRQIPNRMKRETVLSVSKENGTVHFFDKPQALLVDSHHSGTTAVLTLTNEQSLQVAYLLRQQGHHVRLIQATDGFRFCNLVEVRYFMEQLGSSGDGVINRERWELAKRRIQEVYGSSSCLYLINRFVADFEETHKMFYYTDLREFALESSVEDFVDAEKDTIYVSTIHKSKGREFDTVHLLIGKLENLDEEMSRLVYVGITRAKHDLLIYNDVSFMKEYSTIAISLSLRDVWLSFYIDKEERVRKLRSGDKLKYRKGYLLSQQGKDVAYLSKAMRNRLNELEEKGYGVSDAEVSYVLKWHSQDNPQEIIVCLANLVLTKNDTK